MCEVGINKGCNKCPYFYNEEFCILEDDYIDNDNQIIEMRFDDEELKINRIYKNS